MECFRSEAMMRFHFCTYRKLYKGQKNFSDSMIFINIIFISISKKFDYFLNDYKSRFLTIELRFNGRVIENLIGDFILFYCKFHVANPQRALYI